MSVALVCSEAFYVPLADESVHCVVFSPPYWGLRDYGTARWEGGDPECGHMAPPTGGPNPTRYTPGGSEMFRAANDKPYRDICARCGARRIDKQLGLERIPDCLGWATGQPCGECFICNMRRYMKEVWRVLRSDGVCFFNIGDSYAQPTKGGKWDAARADYSPLQQANAGSIAAARMILPNRLPAPGLKGKDLCLIPSRVALALQADGWWVRSDIIWCLSGGTHVYAKTQKGVLPMMVRDMARLDSATVQLWNGEKWTRLLGVSKSARCGDEVEIILRSGERISCTPAHKFPIARGLVEAGNLITGDVIQTCKLPDVENPRDCAIDLDAAWLAGLYIAEGSHSEDTIQIAGHSKEAARWDRVCKVSAKYGGSCTRTIDGNKMNIRIHGKVLNAIIDELVTGHVAKDKGFSPSVWKYSNDFIAAMLDGYLSGDGHYEAENNRWRLGFTRNYNLERDLRTACARLGYRLTLNLATVEYQGKQVPTFRGELRTERSGHGNEKDMGEIVEIRKSKCREVYDLGVADEPHLFALASGALTHNSKPNPMPESVSDRPSRAHEYVWLFTKSVRYYWDQYAVRESGSIESLKRLERGISDHHKNINGAPGQTPHSMNQPRPNRNTSGNYSKRYAEAQPAHGGESNRRDTGYRNLRSVWSIPTALYSGAHFATFPPALVEPCIKAGTSERGCCPTCGKQWRRIIDKSSPPRIERPAPKSKMISNDSASAAVRENGDYMNGPELAKWKEKNPDVTLGWLPGCDCYGVHVPQLPDMPEDAEAPKFCEVCGGEGQIVYTGLGNGQSVPCRYCDETGLEHDGNDAWYAWQAECELIQREREALVAVLDTPDYPVVKPIVFDPFAGSGTTLLVARALGRSAVGCDLSYAYLRDQARERLSLAALERWQSGGDDRAQEINLSNLPLFGGDGGER